MTDELEFPAGCRLLSRWQAGESDATARLKEIFDATIAGEFDGIFARPAPEDRVNVGGSLNLMTLNIMNALYGMESDEFYKGDAERYVRTTLMSRRLLGMNKLYVSWPVYGFTAEAMGQAMMYPDKFPPGSDPDHALITRDNWRDIATPELSTGIPKIIEEMITVYQRLTGLEPILHLSAPYSLAADTFGQEPLLAVLVHEPEFAVELMDHLVDQVLQPWIDRFFQRFANGWVELSDASGSPFFIGPQNCRDVAIRSIRRLIDENPWGHRVYNANFRGDYVTQAEAKNRPGRRRGARNGAQRAVGLEELTDLKHSVCRDFVIRLQDDGVPVSFYEKQAIDRNVPLFMGIGASQIDRNSIEDMQAARLDTETAAAQRVGAIRNVAETIARNGYDNRTQPWPGTVYFEDISSESSFDLIEIIISAALDQGNLSL
ncbi:MAG: hypothetical protein GY952_03335 [Rhodobacteraceae bacterium]|nr:hypothetical protein [Paracoccaceae bacterium]